MSHGLILLYKQAHYRAGVLTIHGALPLCALKENVRPKTFNARKFTLKRILSEQPFVRKNLDFLVKLDFLFKQVRTATVDNRVLSDCYLTLEEKNMMVAHCRGSMHMRKVGLLIEALFQTACRISELADIRLSDCKKNGKVSICVRYGKRCKERTVNLEPELFDEIREVYKGKDFLFENERGGPLNRWSVSRSMKNIAQAVGIEKAVHPHIWRHSYANHMIHIRGKSVDSVARYMGNSIQVCLEHYCHGSMSAEEALDF